MANYNTTPQQRGGASVPSGGPSSTTTIPPGTWMTVSFSEAAKGWTSFKSFIQDGGLSLNNDYYTFKKGGLWKHHTNEIRNNFYGTQSNSHIDVLFNEESATVKSFASMKYEGSQARITQNLGDEEYYNNIGYSGWYVESGITDLQLSGHMEFKNKEGKWFSYMKGVPVKTVEDLNSQEFSFQGIDIFITDQRGCMDPTYANYDPYNNLDCLGNVVTTGYGDTSCCCNSFGCTDPLAHNYDHNVDCDDGSCFYPRWYCDNNVCVEDTDPATSPSRPYANLNECTSNSCGVPGVITGCMDNGNMGQQWWNSTYAVSTGIVNYPGNGTPNYNYNPLATIDDGSCCYATGSGCPDPTACNYDSTTCFSSNYTSCIYAGCNDPLATNYETWHGGCNCDHLDGTCCTYPSVQTYTLTIDDSTNPINQVNYSISTFTKTGMAGDSAIHYNGNQQASTSEYKLEISADAGYTVRASDFAIEFPNGNAATPAGIPVPTVTPYHYFDEWLQMGGAHVGQGNDLGTGPLVYVVLLKDSENPTHDPNWVGPTAANIVTAECWIGTDMQDNIPGQPPGYQVADTQVFMTHNGMHSTNTINPGTPGDLNIEINIIGTAQAVVTGPCVWPHGGLSGGGPVTFQAQYSNLTPGSPPGGRIDAFISLTQPDGPYDIELEDSNGNLYANTFGTTTHTTSLGFAGTVSYDNMPAGQYIARAIDINRCLVWMGMVMN